MIFICWYLYLGIARTRSSAEFINPFLMSFTFDYRATMEDFARDFLLECAIVQIFPHVSLRLLASHALGCSAYQY
jgi:hypothetical protein